MAVTQLRELIDATPWADTHEHLVEEHGRLLPDGYAFTHPTGEPIAIPADWSFLVDRFYALNDLICAGLPLAAAAEVRGRAWSPSEKWDAVERYLDAARNTGFLRAMDLSTERLAGLRLARDTYEEVDERLRALRVEGYYAHVLREVANVGYCHVNGVETDPFCETRQPELLLQDIGLLPLALGRHPAAEAASGVDVGSLDDYVRVVEWCFERYAARAVAVKCAWAYDRTLTVDPPATPPKREFERVRAGEADLAEQRRVEDFLFQRCVDLATEAGLPVKLHLGYLAGTHVPQLRRLFDHVREVVPLLQANPRTTFVLMHIAWPQQEQLLALAKHHPNVVLDLCWAWSLAPLATQDYLEHALTTLPATKLLCFGGDSFTVEHVVGHAEIARRGLEGALAGLVARGWFTPAGAAALVPQLMHGNAERIFPRRSAPPLSQR